MEELLTISETAQLLGVSAQTLRRWDASGRLPAVRVGSHRRYRRADFKQIPGFRPQIFRLAKKWVTGTTPGNLQEEFYCSNSAVFQARLHQMETMLSRIPELATVFPIIVGVAGEIGNNSFDHNLGNWPDVPGVFFAFDLEAREVVLADRGQGILTTLRRVLPDLSDDVASLEVAFSEVISGRAPESRGNGLKFVRQVVSQYLRRLFFRSGNAVLRLKNGDVGLVIRVMKPSIRGCFAKIEY